MIRLAIVLTGSFLVLGTGALAEDAPAQTGDQPGRHVGGWMGMWKQFDKDGDGTLSEQEKADMKAAFKARWEAREQEMLAKFDKDGDGKLSGEEMAEARKAGAGEMRKKIFSELDANGDDKISTEEITAKMEQMRARWGGCGNALESKMTEDEKAAMKSVGEKWIKEMVGKFDTNGDGQISEDEVAAGMESVREQFIKGCGRHGDSK